MDSVARFAKSSAPKRHIRSKTGKERARASGRHRFRHSDSSVRGLRRSAEKFFSAVPGADKVQRNLKKSVKSQPPGRSVQRFLGPVLKDTSQLVLPAREPTWATMPPYRLIQRVPQVTQLLCVSPPLLVAELESSCLRARGGQTNKMSRPIIVYNIILYIRTMI